MLKFFSKRFNSSISASAGRRAKAGVSSRSAFSDIDVQSSEAQANKGKSTQKPSLIQRWKNRKSFLDRFRPKTQERLRLLSTILILLFGLSLIAYPYVSDFAHRQLQGHIIENHDAAVSTWPSDQIRAELDACQVYNTQLAGAGAAGRGPVDLTSPRTPVEYHEEYLKRLNLTGDGVMATIIVPSCDIYAPIYHTTDDEILQEGVGHLEGTSLPIGGDSTHAVVAGHDGLPSLRIFDDLPKIQEGALIVIRVLGHDIGYRVYSMETVLPDETSSLAIQPGQDLLTLITCVPYGINTHRLLVHAERCELPADWDAPDHSVASDLKTEFGHALIPLSLLGLILGICLVILKPWRWVARKWREHKAKKNGMSLEEFEKLEAQTHPEAVRKRSKQKSEKKPDKMTREERRKAKIKARRDRNVQKHRQKNKSKSNNLKK